ncbi:MAG: peptidoglycan-binding protein [bacterium]
MKNFSKYFIILLLAVVLIAPSLSSASFDTSLKYGSSGSAVIELQNFLKDQGLFSGKVDGKFGLITKKAVIAFQLANKLKGDGSFGVLSRKVASTLSLNSNTSNFSLTSDAGVNGGILPTEYTCDGTGMSPQLSWSSVPAGTKEFAVVMSTIPVDGSTKWGWVLYDIPSTTTSLEKNNSVVGISGVGSHGSTLGYQSPCSQGPGDKVYTFSVYALSDSPKLSVPSNQVTGDILLKAISSITLGKASLNLNHARSTTTTESSKSSSFSFAVEADPHMDEQSDANVYKQTLLNIVSAKPSFLIDLGDIFMVDKLADKSATNINDRYVLMKSYYDLLGSIPLYFAMGNHDGEVGWDKLFTKSYREQYFSTQTYDKNYYSFEKNDSLFIVLDPYTYTIIKPTTDGWGWTLGKTQYDWLKTTLEKSTASHKFVFIHQLVGGDNQGRGGIEFAKLYEWGGNNLDGSYGFDTNRVGWGKSIHQLLVDNKVDIVFKGHDHFYAKQELDGVIYQTVPQPSHHGDKIDTAKEYGYLNGEILGGSGYLNVSVSISGVTVKFIKANSTQEVVSSYSF